MFMVTGWRSGQVYTRRVSSASEALDYIAEAQKLQLLNVVVRDDHDRHYSTTDLWLLAGDAPNETPKVSPKGRRGP